MAQDDIQSLFGKTGGGDDEKTESLQLSHQAEKRLQQRNYDTQKKKKKKVRFWTNGCFV